MSLWVVHAYTPSTRHYIISRQEPTQSFLFCRRFHVVLFYVLKNIGQESIHIMCYFWVLWAQLHDPGWQLLKGPIIIVYLVGMAILLLGESIHGLIKVTPFSILTCSNSWIIWCVLFIASIHSTRLVFMFIHNYFWLVMSYFGHEVPKCIKQFLVNFLISCILMGTLKPIEGININTVTSISTQNNTGGG